MPKRIGIWASNGYNPDVHNMYRMKPGAITVISDYISQNSVSLYKAENPDVDVIIRFMHPLNWLDNIDESARTQADRVISKWAELSVMNPYIYFGNEMNLHYECNDTNPGNQWKYQTQEHYRRIYDWSALVARIIRDAIPDINLIPPPMAYGHNEDGEPDDSGNPKLGWAGYDFLAPYIGGVFDNVVPAHYYWGNQFGSDMSMLHGDSADWYAFRWKRVLNLFKERYNLDIKMIIDEAGGFGASDDDFAEQVLYYAENTLSDDRIIALTYFLWHDPTNSPGNILNSWTQNAKGLNDLVNKVSEFEIPDSEQPPNNEQPPSEVNEMFRTFEESKDVLDESLHYHAVDSSGKIVGSVARIIPVDVAQEHWNKNDMPKDGDKYWRVKRATLISEELSMGDFDINLSFLDEDGSPYSGAQAWFAYPSSALSKESWVGAFDNGMGNVFSYPNGQGGIAQGKNGFAPAIGSEEIGPYVVGYAGMYSEVIAGFGMTGNRHISYAVTFQLATYGSGDTTPPPDETPAPPSGNKGCGGLFAAIAYAVIRYFDE